VGLKNLGGCYNPESTGKLLTAAMESEWPHPFSDCVFLTLQSDMCFP
jgi:hypothetical protein